MTSEEILLRLATIIVLGIAAQWLAWSLRVPAILLLLAIGIFAGPGSEWLAASGYFFSQRFLDPGLLFGDLLLPAVSLSVAIILFEGGLTLNVRELSQAGSVIWRLVTLGALATWVISAAAAKYCLGMQWPVAVLMGAILVVTGPTVIGPLLRHVKPVGQVGPILKWEGIVIDPIGVLLAVVVFEVIAAEEIHFGAAAITVFQTVLAGCVSALLGCVLLIVVLRRQWVPDYLHSALTLMTVVAAFSGANFFKHEAGLFSVTILGIVLANQRWVRVHHIMEFKETLTLLLLSGLFIILGSRLQLAAITGLNWGTAAFIGVLIFIARPATVALCTIGSSLTWRERVFLASMAPRGIVAAAVSSVFALRLADQGYSASGQLVPATFAVIISTVTLYGLGASLIAKLLGVAPPGQQGFLVAGANPIATAIAHAIYRAGYQVLLVDTNRQYVQTARLAGLPVMPGSIMSQYIVDRLELSSIGKLMALTSNDEVNSLAVVRYTRMFGRANVFQLATARRRSERNERVSDELQGRVLFRKDATYELLAGQLEQGAVVKTTSLTKEFSFDEFRRVYGNHAIPLMLIDESGNLSLFLSDSTPTPKAGQTLISLVSSDAIAGQGRTPVATNVS